MIVHTKDGKPFKLSDENLFNESGEEVARLHGDKAFGPDGQYIATLVGHRLIHFSSDSAYNGSAFDPETAAGFSHTRDVGVVTYGDEPEFNR